MSTPPEPAAILAALCAIVARVTARPALPLTPAMRLEAIDNLDSLRLLETIALVEEHFAVAVDTGGFDDLVTIGDIVRLVEAAPPA